MASTSADVLFLNVRAFTAEAADPFAEAVAVKGNRILFVGSAEEAHTWHGPGTHLVDGGKAVDARFHRQPFPHAARVADRPVFIVGYDGHTAWANTLALKEAGIFHGGIVGPNSEIVLDEHGEATADCARAPRTGLRNSCQNRARQKCAACSKRDWRSHPAWA